MHERPAPVFAWLAIALAFAAAAVSYACVERPILRLGHRLGPRAATAASAADRA
jgi:peptidoglycan/LPS O-acetylase OafA/YrhL